MAERILNGDREQAIRLRPHPGSPAASGTMGFAARSVSHSTELWPVENAVATSPGTKFTVLGKTYTKSDPWLKESADGIPVIYDSEGRTIRLREAENRAFWALATVNILRHTGVRIEEMLEISHYSITQYRLPTA